ELQGTARDQVELTAVLPAFDGAALDVAVAQRDLLVRADVLEGVDAAVLVAHQGDLEVADGDVDRLAGGEVRQGGHGDEGVRHQFMLRASSSSMEAERRSRISGTSICWMISAKKPRTTRRRASISGMPRARRKHGCASSKRPVATGRPGPSIRPG